MIFLYSKIASMYLLLTHFIHLNHILTRFELFNGTSKFSKTYACADDYMCMIYLNLYSVPCVISRGGTQYKSGYRDVPQTWVAKSGRQVHQWVPFFQKHGTLMGLFFKIF